ncbi:MAG: hypothetical protein ABEJ76_09860 [Halanaeroarchaeum sp.]
MWSLDTVRNAVSAGIVGVLDRLTSVYDYGTPIWEFDWDVLVVLDACRVDAMEAVADEYDFVESVGETYSVASDSPTWMRRNLANSPPSRPPYTAYLTGNPWSAEVDVQTRRVVEVWRDRWDDELGTVRPSDVTRAAATYYDRHTHDLIVHYVQPHVPFLDRPELNPAVETSDWTGTVTDEAWDRVRRGDLPESVVWEAYVDNLRHVLDSVETLLEAIDAETVIVTADHANAIGEFGLYGHPNVPIPAIRRVPLIETSGSGTADVEPLEIGPESGTRRDAASRLEDLGYA